MKRRLAIVALKQLLVFAAITGFALLAVVVLTRDPTHPAAVALVIAGAATSVGALAALAAVTIEERWTVGPRRPRRMRGLRRGLEIGAALAAVGALRAIDALTPITAGFVLGGFALAEMVLSSRPTARSR